MYKNIHNVLNFVEGYVAVTAIVGIFAFTMLGAFSINPVAEVSSEEGAVAGISTVNSLNWNSLYTYPNHQVSFESNLESGFTNFQIVPKYAKEGIFEVDLAEITNDTSNVKRMKASLEINGPVLDALEVYLMDDGNWVPLYYENISSSYEITISPESDKVLTIQYDIEENINFPFILNFSFKEF